MSDVELLITDNCLISETINWRSQHVLNIRTQRYSNSWSKLHLSGVLVSINIVFLAVMPPVGNFSC